MRHLWMLIFALLSLTGVEAQVRFEQGSTDKIRKMAVEADKLVFIDLYAVWCGPCQTMDRQVFARKEVSEFFDRHFVAVKYNVDHPTGAELMQRYGRGAIPLYLIFATDGRLVGRIVGMRSARQLLDDLQQMIDHEQER